MPLIFSDKEDYDLFLKEHLKDKNFHRESIDTNDVA